MDRLFALARLRFTLTLRASRGVSRVLDLLALAIMVVVGTVIALGLAALVTIIAGTLLAGGAPDDRDRLGILLRVVFAAVYGLALVAPIATGTVDPGLDVSRLRVFPIRSGQLWLLTFGAAWFSFEHLLWLPTLLGLALVLPAGGLSLAVVLAALLLGACCAVAAAMPWR